jgi:prolyl oligopeptidase
MDYPQARTCDQVDDYFGTKVADPYRWMEDIESTELSDWLDAQNALTRSHLDQLPGREQLVERLKALMDAERWSMPVSRGSRYFYGYNSGLQDQDVLIWQDGLDGDPQVWLDPNMLSADGTVAVTAWSASENGRFVAYALSDGGSDWMRWQVRDIEAGTDLDDTIVRSKFCGASWAADGSGFYYSGYGLSEDESLKEANHFHRSFFHALGTDQADDVVVYERPDDGELLTWTYATEDGEFLLQVAARGSNPDNDLVVRRLADGSEVTLSVFGPGTYSPIGNVGSTFWLQTTVDAPKGKVVAVDLERPDAWREVLPESEHSLESAGLVGDVLIASYLTHAHSTVQLHDREGRLLEQVELPGIGSTLGFHGRVDDTETFFSYSSFIDGGGIYRLDLPSRAVTPWRVPVRPFDPADYVSEQIFVTSKDGTQVPLFVNRRKDVEVGAGAPVMLYGYGGFNVALTPGYASSRLLWMELGGVFASACLRGGGEYGEDWHQAGTKLKKQNVFDDFIACAEWLVSSGWATPERLVINGGSNGGLLVGAVEQQRPDLFGAAIAEVGVMDMMRFDQFTIGWGWKSDYGSPTEDAAESAALQAYSPVHNVKAGTRYPATLVMTGDHDDRVFPAHSFKYAAALQAGQDPDGPPVLLRVDRRAGHGAGMPLSKQLEQVADKYLFALHTLGTSR